jgi:predicted membrane chloride channel (bestrophin family)
MADSRTDPIRNAIASREFRKARKLWNEYMVHLREELRRGTLTHAQLDEARELKEGARVALLCARAHIRNRLRSLQVAGRYGEPPPTEKRRAVQTSL